MTFVATRNFRPHKTDSSPWFKWGAPFPAGFAGSGAFDFEVVESQEENWGRSVSGHSFSRRGPLTPIRHHKKRADTWLSIRPFLSKQAWRLLS